MRRSYCCFLLSLVLRASGVSAQTNEIPYATVSLQNLNAFRAVGGNWKIVGDAFYDLNEAGKGTTKPGVGVLVNDPSGKSKDHLLTSMEHGDIELELDFMMEKKSNSGVFLQGRYEVQLMDSWGIKNPGSADCGAIYERWDESRPAGRNGYEGHPPTQNVSRAPGLWQHLKVVFRAPRFNEKGEKTANARFMKVIQNGVTLHENTEVSGPTRAAAFRDEKPLGPLMLQGDHGAVAIRNVRYKSYGNEPVTLTKMKLSAYEGQFESLADMAAATPRQETDLAVLAHQAPASRDKFGGKITGVIHIPRTGQYLLKLNLSWIPPETDPGNPNGAGALTIAGRPVLNISGKTGGMVSALVNLEAGDQPLVLAYYKKFALWYARSNDIVVAIEGPGVAYTTLNPVIRTQEPVGEISVLAKGEPVMQRGFVNHRGTKHTHTISVGEPDLANYTVDLQKGQFLQIWRGDFLETTPMWHGRGETQLSVPMGSVIELSGKPSLTLLTDRSAVWPDSNASYTNLGYDIDKVGRPVFKYTLGGAGVRESFTTQDNGRKLAHTFTITPGASTPGASAPGASKGEIWCLLAEGSDITELPNGLYAINDKEYFIELSAKEKPVIRSTAKNTKELLLPVKSKDSVGTVSYSLIW